MNSFGRARGSSNSLLSESITEGIPFREAHSNAARLTASPHPLTQTTSGRRASSRSPTAFLISAPEALGEEKSVCRRERESAETSRTLNSSCPVSSIR